GWPFVFEAEDGIRASHVTGVQTCALPISEAIIGGVAHRTARPVAATLRDIDLDGHHRIAWRIGQSVDAHRGVAEQFAGVQRSLRSEERRVGTGAFCQSPLRPPHISTLYGR